MERPTNGQGTNPQLHFISCLRGKAYEVFGGENELFRTFAMKHVNLCEIYVKQTQVYREITLYLEGDSEKP